ncbi:LysR family transcriptional regulator [Klebsiella variicola]|uniref:LysR family transcriptional regulator n=1 Tax=Klebsiella variicola TaxID=244366 RepID=A0A7H4MG95_KLEVA|nr:LysR family transcriptional regulator [Klebsiella variicola]
MIGQATSQVINDIHQDYLRIHSAPSFGLLWLMPRLDKFRQAWPELKISLTCSYESIQFSRDILISIFVTGYHSGQRCWSEPLKMSVSCPTAQRLI